MPENQVLSDEFLSSAIGTSFGDFEYEDGELIVVRRGDRLDMPASTDNPPPLQRFMRPAPRA